jgi:[acyl-carrier-protein] S-malonyltransferase
MRADTMGMTAFVFPGQGSQYVGMARDLFEAHPGSRALMEKADAILGIPLCSICFKGPEEELRQTRNTQPAIFLHSMALFEAMHTDPAMVAGHSLGEYSALVAARALSFEDALRLVRLRGELMQRAGEEHPGTMAAVVGLSPPVIEEICREAAAAGVVQPANFNSPGQIVISGSVPGVRKGMEIAKSRGARMVKELVVSGAFHSPLMASAQQGLKEGLDKTAIRDARIPVYANVTAEPVRGAEEIRTLLFRQLTSPVRWEETVNHMTRDGMTSCTEIGPGKVLQGLTKRIAPQVTTAGVERWRDITQEVPAPGPENPEGHRT